MQGDTGLPEPSSTGFDPRTAAALAYLAGPLTGALVLLAERTSGYVRFHAWQSILGLGLVWAVGLAFWSLAFAMLFVSASAFHALLGAAWVAWSAWLVAWAGCLAAALTGRRWRFPLVGGYAARLAGRA